jgi:hypothetical protein
VSESLWVPYLNQTIDDCQLILKAYFSGDQGTVLDILIFLVVFNRKESFQRLCETNENPEGIFLTHESEESLAYRYHSSGIYYSLVGSLRVNDSPYGESAKDIIHGDFLCLSNLCICGVSLRELIVLKVLFNLLHELRCQWLIFQVLID